MKTDEPPLSPPTPAERRRLAWFSLLSFLVILLLGFYSMPGGCGGPGSVREARENRRPVITLANAIEQYWTEYGRLPAPPRADAAGAELDTDTDIDTDTDTGREAGLISVLSGPGPGNTRGHNFLEGHPSAESDPGAPAGWRNGLVSAPPGETALYDARGLVFRVRLDTGGDHRLANPNPDHAARGQTTLPKRVAVWGAGKDGDWTTWEDNVMSWE